MPYKQQQAVVRVSLSTKAEIDKLTAATGLSIPKLVEIAISYVPRDSNYLRLLKAAHKRQK